MTIQIDPETMRGVWLIYFYGTREVDPPFRGTLCEAIYQATRDGRQFEGGRLGTIVVPISIELPEPQIEERDRKIISLAAAIARIEKPQQSKEERQAQYSERLKKLGCNADPVKDSKKRKRVPFDITRMAQCDSANPSAGGSQE